MRSDHNARKQINPTAIRIGEVANKLRVEQNKSDVKPFKSDGTKQIKLQQDAHLYKNRNKYISLEVRMYRGNI